MTNPYNDNTKKKVIDRALSYSLESEKFAKACILGASGTISRWDYAGHMMGNAYVSAALHEYAWSENTKTVDAWLQFNLYLEKMKKDIEGDDVYYKITFNEQVKSTIEKSKVWAEVRNALKNPSVKPEQIAI